MWWAKTTFHLVRPLRIFQMITDINHSIDFRIIHLSIVVVANFKNSKIMWNLTDQFMYNTVNFCTESIQHNHEL